MAERLQEHIRSAGLKNPNANLQRAAVYRSQLAQAKSPSEVFNLSGPFHKFANVFSRLPAQLRVVNLAPSVAGVH